jgi:hypothetical protein
MAQRISGDFEDIFGDYPECTQYVTADVTLDVNGISATPVSATIEKYQITPNGQQRYLLRVWNSAKKPDPKPIVLRLGKDQVEGDKKETSKK